MGDASAMPQRTATSLSGETSKPSLSFSAKRYLFLFLRAPRSAQLAPHIAHWRDRKPSAQLAPRIAHWRDGKPRASSLAGEIAERPFRQRFRSLATLRVSVTEAASAHQRVLVGIIL
jgi:hypothetical protein